MLQNMVINSGDSNCSDNTCSTDQCLLFKIIHITSMLYFCHIGTGTVKHDQSKACQKHDRGHKTVIIIICFYFWFCLCLCPCQTLPCSSSAAVGFSPALFLTAGSEATCLRAVLSCIPSPATFFSTHFLFSHYSRIFLEKQWDCCMNVKYLEYV